MSIEDIIRQIIREENEKHLEDIRRLLESHGYHEVPRFLTVPEAAKILRIGRTATYELCRQSEHNGFPCIREGHKIRIPYNALMNWINQKTSQ
ncbi:helix-turn-helix domain-containing protein [Virgibacillus sp. YIM 98842]|uniref:helix-turn-helix domain-containing protein n=1 Tax=Virgibacillus sp. YIM 98842 TaxID=2663533 RepID=UPI0013DB3D38|nr:helix-turn-helix domain-containing protein [Virgibacillus sp. YIM 98842]